MAVEDPTKGFDMTVASSDEAVRRVALEDLQPGAAICGVLPHALVTAVSAAWYGAHRARAISGGALWSRSRLKAGVPENSPARSLRTDAPWASTPKGTSENSPESNG
jgi:hypothetical protein